MGKVQRVYLEVMPDGKVMEGVTNGNKFDCRGCYFYRKNGPGECVQNPFPFKCFPEKNPLSEYIIYKDTGKRVRKV